MEFVTENNQPEVKETPVGGQIMNNVKRLSVGDGSLRIEGGAMIISDENGVDRVLIGYGESLF